MIAYIDQIAKSEGKTVTIRGWLHNRRSSGKIHFLSVRDGTGFIQAIVSKAAVGDEKFKQADHLSQETALIVHGTVRADSRAPASSKEIRVLVEASKKRFTMTLPRSAGTFFTLLAETSRNPSAVSRM